MKLERLADIAAKDEDTRKILLKTKEDNDPLSAFCRAAACLGVEIYPMDLVAAGEEMYAAMKRSTNGGGENSPMLEGEDDLYEMFMKEIEGMEQDR